MNGVSIFVALQILVCLDADSESFQDNTIVNLTQACNKWL